MELRRETIVRMIKELEELIESRDKDCIELEWDIASRSLELDEWRAGLKVMTQNRDNLMVMISKEDKDG